MNLASVRARALTFVPAHCKFSTFHSLVASIHYYPMHVAVSCCTERFAGEGSGDSGVDGWLLKELVIKAGWHFRQDDAEMYDCVAGISVCRRETRTTLHAPDVYRRCTPSESLV